MTKKYIVLSDTQTEAVAAVEHHESVTAAAKALGVSRSSLKGRLEGAAMLGVVPNKSLAPAENAPGMAMSKTTVQYNNKGEVVQEWRRSSPTETDLEDFVDRLCERVDKKASRIPKAPRTVSKDLMLELPVADLHLGMYAWAGDTHNDYDIDIATNLHLGALDSLLQAAPDTGKAALVFPGDLLHTDNRSGLTERGKNVLDLDTRFSHLVDSATKLLVDSVNMCAEKSKEVELIIMSGNHDWHMAQALSRVLAAYYHGQKRVTVRTDPFPRQYIRHGKVLLGYAHGDKKTIDLAQTMSVEQPQAWGETEYRYWRCGHFHHTKKLSPLEVDEKKGATIEFLPSLAARDAWHVEMGYVGSLREARSYIWHAEYGLQTVSHRPARMFS